MQAQIYPFLLNFFRIGYGFVLNVIENSVP